MELRNPITWWGHSHPQAGVCASLTHLWWCCETAPAVLLGRRSPWCSVMTTSDLLPVHDFSTLLCSLNKLIVKPHAVFCQHSLTHSAFPDSAGLIFVTDLYHWMSVRTFQGVCTMMKSLTDTFLRMFPCHLATPECIFSCNTIKILSDRPFSKIGLFRCWTKITSLH
jgi:hypothetical protein